MNYTILKQWKTSDGQYHASADANGDYGSAFDFVQSMSKQMKKDTNVLEFRFMIFDERGFEIKRCGWYRAISESA